MKCDIEKINKQIFHFRFEKQYTMCMTLLRIQEFYESPYFQDSLFTLEDYMDWYTRKNGSFDYLDVVDGINIPSEAIFAFWKVYKDKLRDKEVWFFNKLEEIRDNKRKFCVIGTHKESPDTLRHELSHAHYYLKEDYRNAVNNCAKRFKLKRFAKALRDNGYCESVLLDEMHSYALTGWPDFFKPTKECLRFKKALKKIEKKYLGELS